MELVKDPSTSNTFTCFVNHVSVSQWLLISFYISSMIIRYIDVYNKIKKVLAATVLSSLAAFEIMAAILNK